MHYNLVFIFVFDLKKCKNNFRFSSAKNLTGFVNILPT